METTLPGSKAIPPTELLAGQSYVGAEIVSRWAGRALHCSELGWYSWRGTRWEPDPKVPIRAATETVAHLRGLVAAAGGGPKEDRGLERVATSIVGLKGSAEWAAAYPPISAELAEIDGRPELLNGADGTVDLTSGELLRHDPAHRITKTVRGQLGAGPLTPGEWHRFVERVLPDPEIRGFVQRLLGSALLGQVRDHVLPIFTGTGANGKTTLLETVRHVLGDYAIEASPDLLLEGERHPTEQADLFGVRLAICEETDRGRPLAEATMKRLVGGVEIRARKMRRDSFSFPPSHLLVMVTNHLPEVSGDDPAIWRRLLVVPFTVVIPPAEQDPDLTRRLQTDHADAVLAWLLAGWTDYQLRGLDAPAAVRARTEDYRTTSDLLGQFLEDGCWTGEHLRAQARALYSAWSAWCKDSGELPGSETEFAKSLANRPGITRKRERSGTVYLGVGLRGDDDETL